MTALSEACAGVAWSATPEALLEDKSLACRGAEQWGTLYIPTENVCPRRISRMVYGLRPNALVCATRATRRTCPLALSPGNEQEIAAIGSSRSEMTNQRASLVLVLFTKYLACTSFPVVDWTEKDPSCIEFPSDICNLATSAHDLLPSQLVPNGPEVDGMWHSLQEFHNVCS